MAMIISVNVIGEEKSHLIFLKSAFPLLPVMVCMFIGHFNFSSVSCLSRALAHFSIGFFIFSYCFWIPSYILDRNPVSTSGRIKKSERRPWVWVKSTVSEARLPGFRSSVCHLLAVWPWPSHSTSLYLSSLVWEMGRVVIVPTSHCGKIQWMRAQ